MRFNHQLPSPALLTTPASRIIVTAVTLLAAASGATLPAAAYAQDTGTLDSAAAAKAFPPKPPYSPYAGRNYPTRPLFGDTHLHTSFSMDAGAFGARLAPRDAYRFARGEEVTASSGQPAKLSRPLDFLVVADHSDGMGFFPLLLAGGPEIKADSQGPQMERANSLWQGGGGGARHHRQLRQGYDLEGDPAGARHGRLPRRVAGNHRRRRSLQRPGSVHGVHRVRVDLEHRRKQSSPQRHLPRQRRQGQPSRTVHHPETTRQRQSGRPLEVDGCVRREDRWQRARPGA